MLHRAAVHVHERVKEAISNNKEQEHKHDVGRSRRRKHSLVVENVDTVNPITSFPTCSNFPSGAEYDANHMPGDPVVQCHPYPLLLLDCKCCWSDARGPNQLANHSACSKPALREKWHVYRHRICTMFGAR